MKKTIFKITTLVCCIGLVNSAIADELEAESQDSMFRSVFSKSDFEKHFSASVGVKAWRNSWSLPISFSKKNFTNGTSTDIEKINMSFDSETETVFLPTFSLRYRNFFVSGSYFPKTDYSFQEQTKMLYTIDVENEFIANGIVSGTLWNITSEREELDINLGYYLTPSLVITAGYKKIDRNFNIDYVYLYMNEIGNPLQFSLKNSANQSTDGFTLGLAGVAPLKGKFGIYGSFAFGWLNTDKEISRTQDGEVSILGDNRSYDADYYLGELGLVYSSKFDKIPMLNAASFYLGYRFQVLNEEVMPNSTDMTDGFVLGVNLNF